MPSPIRGRVAFIFDEDNYDIDRIIGVENIKRHDLDGLARVAMRDYEEDFAAKVKPGDVLVGGSNFGYGHPHYPAMMTMRHLGVAGVVAESFSPGYWRGEISMGFPQMTCPGILGAVERWDEIEVDWTRWTLRNLTRGKELAIEPLSSSEIAMIEQGGLIGYLKSTG